MILNKTKFCKKFISTAITIRELKLKLKNIKIKF